jgi:hypothetical protein
VCVVAASLEFVLKATADIYPRISVSALKHHERANVLVGYKVIVFGCMCNPVYLEAKNAIHIPVPHVDPL